jgi:hypothetical protein
MLINSTFQHTKNMSVDSKKRKQRGRKKAKEGKVLNPTLTVFRYGDVLTDRTKTITVPAPGDCEIHIGT